MHTGNMIKTVILMAALTALFMLVGQWLGGTTGMIIALLLVGVMNFSAYWFSDRLALAMTGAQEVSPTQAPDLYYLVQRIAQASGLPMPRVYIIPDASPNAFATGRDPKHAAVAVTTGILNLLSERELAAVLAHELGHIRNRDTLISTIVATMAGAITQLAYFAQWALLFGGFGRNDDEEHGNAFGGLLMVIVAPIAATLIQLAVSRAREYEADATGARLIGDPLALASALRKLQLGVSRQPMDVNPATAHLFIVNPLSAGELAGLFSTHPPLEERIRRLERMAASRVW
jgi:heat shock protein HtpX